MLSSPNTNAAPRRRRARTGRRPRRTPKTYVLDYARGIIHKAVGLAD
jgi:hypothetical protein